MNKCCHKGDGKSDKGDSKSDDYTSARAERISVSIPNASDIDANLYWRKILFENLPTTGSDTGTHTFMPRLDTSEQYRTWRGISHGTDTEHKNVTVAEVAWRLLKKKHETTFPGSEFNVDRSMMPILVLRKMNFWPIILQIKSLPDGQEITTSYIDDFVSVLNFNLSQIRLALEGWNETLLGSWRTKDPSTVKIFGFVFSSVVQLSQEFKQGHYGLYPRFVTHENYDDILTTTHNHHRTFDLGAEKSPWDLRSGDIILDVNSNFWRNESTDLLNLQSNGENQGYRDRGTFENSDVCMEAHPAMGNSPFFLTKVHTDVNAQTGMFAGRHFIFIGGYSGGTTEEAKSIICHEMMHTFLGVFDTYKLGTDDLVCNPDDSLCSTDHANRSFVWQVNGTTMRGDTPDWFATFPEDKTILHYSRSLTAFDVAYIRMQYKRQIDSFRDRLAPLEPLAVIVTSRQGRMIANPTVSVHINKVDLILFVVSLLIGMYLLTRKQHSVSHHE